MRLKMLFFPAGIITVLALFIGWIWPGFQEVMEKRETFAQKNQILVSAKERQSNVNALFSQIDAELEKKQALLDYLPVEEEEQQAVNMIGFLVGKTGNLSVSDIGVVESKGQLVRRKASPVITSEDVQQISKAKAELKKDNFQVTVSVLGEYRFIKEFLGAFYELHRENDIYNISIDTQVEQSADTTKKVISKFLLADISVRFSDASEVRVKDTERSPAGLEQDNDGVKEPLPSVLSSEQAFNLDIIDQYIARASQTVPAISTATGSGRENPFLLP